jgi:hypothetical protein
MGSLHPSLVKEITEVKVVPFMPIPAIRGVVINWAAIAEGEG